MCAPEIVTALDLFNMSLSHYFTSVIVKPTPLPYVMIIPDYIKKTLKCCSVACVEDGGAVEDAMDGGGNSLLCDKVCITSSSNSSSTVTGVLGALLDLNICIVKESF